MGRLEALSRIMPPEGIAREILKGSVEKFYFSGAIKGTPRDPTVHGRETLQGTVAAA